MAKRRSDNGPSFNRGTLNRNNKKERPKSEPEYVRDVLDETAKRTCCGISCCNYSWTTKDHGTGEFVSVFVVNGEIKTALKKDFEEAFATGTVDALP